MFPHLDASGRQILSGNLLIILCCAFYLAWWLIAFHPAGGIRGMRSGWLLIPAFLCGVAALILILLGYTQVGPMEDTLLPGRAIAIGGLAVYLLLLAVTSLLLHRQVTTELFLIVGWAVLMLLELNALLNLTLLSRPGAWGLFIVTLVIVAIALVCYILYYNLDAVWGYLDGTAPLVLCGVMTAAITIAAAR